VTIHRRWLPHAGRRPVCGLARHGPHAGPTGLRRNGGGIARAVPRVRNRFAAKSRSRPLDPYPAEKFSPPFAPPLSSSSPPARDTGANDHRDRSGAGGRVLGGAFFGKGEPLGSDVRVGSVKAGLRERSA
jgi:hypothetical protein